MRCDQSPKDGNALTDVTVVGNKRQFPKSAETRKVGARGGGDVGLLPEETLSWYAVRVIPQHEQSVASQFRRKGMEEFVPTFKGVRQWSDRSKVLTLPLFSGYLFCRTKRSLFSSVLNTQGVFQIVSFGGKAYPLPDSEIDTLRRVIGSGYKVAPVAYQTAGPRVKVVDGPLAGIVGILAIQGNCLILSVDPIMRSVSVDVANCELWNLATTQ